MKQKNRVWVLFVACIAVIPLHIVEIYRLTDPATGFYKTEGTAPWLLCIGIILAAVAVGTVLKYRIRKSPKTAPTGGLLLPVAAWVTALALGYDFFGEVYFGSQGNTFHTANMLFLALAILFFMFFGVYCRQEKPLPTLLNFFSIPLMGYRLLEKFLSTKGMAIISEHVYDLFLRCFMLLAYLALAKVLCEIDLRKTSRQLLRWATATAMLAVLCTVPGCILWFMGNNGVLHTAGIPVLSDLCLGLFLVLFCLELLSDKNIQKAHPPAEPVPQPKAEKSNAATPDVQQIPSSEPTPFFVWEETEEPQ